MNMKKIIMAIVAAIALSATAVAQDQNRQERERRQQPDRTEMMKRRTAEMVKTYGLNEEQAQQLLELNTKFADRMGGFQRGGNNDRRQQMERRPQRNGQQGDTLNTDEQRQRVSREGMEDRRKEMEQSREEYAAELQKIMTEEQYKAYQADMQKRMQNGPQGRRGQRPTTQGQ